MKTSILVLLLSLVAAASCTGDPISLSGSTKDISVGVAGGVIKVGEDPALADQSRNVVKWTLDTATISAGYRFPYYDGIAQDNAAATPPSACRKIGNFDHAFHNCKAKDSGKAFQCNRVNGVFEPDACYKYVVKLDGSPSVSPLDPWMKNN